jgi:hypothetical protein
VLPSHTWHTTTYPLHDDELVRIGQHGVRVSVLEVLHKVGLHQLLDAVMHVVHVRKVDDLRRRHDTHMPQI